MDPLKMYFLLKIWMFHCYVSVPEGRLARHETVKRSQHIASIVKVVPYQLWSYNPYKGEITPGKSIGHGCRGPSYLGWSRWFFNLHQGGKILTASLPLKNGGKGRFRIGFLIIGSNGNFSGGELVVKLREATQLSPSKKNGWEKLTHDEENGS